VTFDNVEDIRAKLLLIADLFKDHDFSR